MFCKYCGQKIDDDSTFCSGCGAKLSIAVPQHKQPHLNSSDQIQSKSILPPTVDMPATKQADTEEYESFDPTFENIMAQFSPLGKIVFIILCILMVIWVATLTLHVFFPEYINYLLTL